ncbi:MAG: hypothetical protein ABI147_14530 [Acidobacteriaceae bacterium]
MTSPPEYRAAPPGISVSTRKQQRESAERDAYYAEREQVERRRQLRGLLVLGLIVIAVSIARAGVDRVFTQGWWRLW